MIIKLISSMLIIKLITNIHVSIKKQIFMYNSEKQQQHIFMNKKTIFETWKWTRIKWKYVWNNI